MECTRKPGVTIQFSEKISLGSRRECWHQNFSENRRKRFCSQICLEFVKFRAIFLSKENLFSPDPKLFCKRSLSIAFQLFASTSEEVPFRTYHTVLCRRYHSNILHRTASQTPEIAGTWFLLSVDRVMDARGKFGERERRSTTVRGDNREQL